MNAFNRVFAALVALAWMAAWGVALYLMWTPDRELRVDNRYAQFMFDLSLGGSDRMLATIIAAAAIALGAALLFAQAMPRRGAVRRMDHETVRGEEGRFRELHERLDNLQRRVDQRDVEGRPVAPGQPVMADDGGYRERPRRRWGFGRERR